MNVNELRVKYLQAAEQEQAALRAYRDALPPHEMQHGVFVSLHPTGVKIGYGTTGAEMGYTNAQAVFIRDRLLAAYPLDTAPDAGWVSVEERLPASPKDVLVWTQGRSLLAWHDNTRSVWFERSNERRELSPVTHWRELPAPPAAKGGSGE